MDMSFVVCWDTLMRSQQAEVDDTEKVTVQFG